MTWQPQILRGMHGISRKRFVERGRKPRVRKHRPYRLIGSPPCTVLSILQNVQRIKLGGSAKVDAEIERAKVHVEFGYELYKYR